MHFAYRIVGRINYVKATEDQAAACWYRLAFEAMGQTAAVRMWEDAHTNTRNGSEARLQICDLTSGGVIISEPTL